MSEHQNNEIDREIGLAHVFNETVPVKLFDQFDQLIKNSNSQYKHSPELSEDKKTYHCSYETYDYSVLEKWSNLMGRYENDHKFLIIIEKFKIWLSNIFKK